MVVALSSRTVGLWSVVHAAGELDLSNIDELSNVIDVELERHPRLAIDLSAVTFVDSSVLGVLVSALERARKRDGDVVLVGAAGSPLRVLEITGLDRAFTVVPAVDQLPAS
jgi:anti-sigma B factor antagonist